MYYIWFDNQIFREPLYNYSVKPNHPIIQRYQIIKYLNHCFFSVHILIIKYLDHCCFSVHILITVTISAKVAEFGIARLAPDCIPYFNSSSRTIGYLDP